MLISSATITFSINESIAQTFRIIVFYVLRMAGCLHLVVHLGVAVSAAAPNIRVIANFFIIRNFILNT